MEVFANETVNDKHFRDQSLVGLSISVLTNIFSCINIYCG